MSKERARRLVQQADEKIEAARKLLETGNPFDIRRAEELNLEAELLLAEADEEENKD